MSRPVALLGRLSSGLRRLLSPLRQWPTARLSARFDSWLSDFDLLLQWLVYRVVGGFSGWWQRDETLWLFGARGGNEFSDNAKYLFLWVAANDPAIRPVWLTHSDAVCDRLQSNGYEAYRAWSLRGIVLSLRAGVVCVTQGLRDVNMGCVAGATLVQLWHGIPLKKIAWDAEWPDAPWPVRRCHRTMAAEIDLVTTPAEASIGPLSSGLTIDPDRFAVTGYPRNDALITEIPSARIGMEEAAVRRVESAADEGQVVLYLPTYRSEGESFVSQLDYEALDRALSAADAQLFIKAHPAEPVECEAGSQSRIHWLPAAVEPYALLPHADILLTDYSSVYFDYLMLDRPVVFFPYDLDRYTETRGLYFEYDAVTAGPTATDPGALAAALTEALVAAAGGPDSYAAERARLREQFCFAPAGTAAETVYRTIIGSLSSSSEPLDADPDVTDSHPAGTEPTDMGAPADTGPPADTRSPVDAGTPADMDAPAESEGVARPTTGTRRPTQSHADTAQQPDQQDMG